LLATTQWLESLGQPETAPPPQAPRLRRWARRRLGRLHQRLQTAARVSQGDDYAQHGVRILAKHLRYAIEALESLWRKPWARSWQQQALVLQSSLGATRDLVRAVELIDALGSDAALVAFVRGVALGRVARRPPGKP